MKLKQISAAIAALAVIGAAHAGGGALGSIGTATFGNTVSGNFTDTWTFTLDQDSNVGASVTNVILGVGIYTYNGIFNLASDVGGTPLVFSVTPVPTSSFVNNGAATTFLMAGNYSLTVTGFAPSASSYGGNVIAVAIPEPETYAMMLAGLACIGFVAARRRNV